jgi:alpha-tubulin suppressor-like RCC1 family protein
MIIIVLHVIVVEKSIFEVRIQFLNIPSYLGIGLQNNSYHKPILNQYLNNEFVFDISCAFHSHVLKNCGEVYAWGGNRFGQIGNGCNNKQLIPIKVKGFNSERVLMI